MKPALILTLENTVVSPNSRSKESIHPLDWKFHPNILRVIKEYTDKHYKVFIISNQLSIYNELITEGNFLKKMNLIVNRIEHELNLQINTIGYDYEIDINSYRFLPKPGMLYEFALDHEIDLHDSLVVGSGMYDIPIAKYIGAEFKDINLI